MTDIAELGLMIRSDGVVVAKDRLGAFTKSAHLADAATTKLIGTAMKLVGAYATWRVAEGIVRKYIDATVESDRVQRRLETVILSTGGAAGWTAGELNTMAKALQSVTTEGDEAINSAQAILLTYGRIGHDIIPLATEAVLDMSAAMGTDLASAAERVGKALDIPSRGMAALAKQGFFFTAEQEKMVKMFEETGQLAKAQKIVLDELAFAYGGAARAARGTLGGALSALQEAFDDLFEANGPASERLRTAVEGLIDKITDPGFIASVQNFGATLFNVIASVIPLIQQIIDFLNRLGGVSGSGGIGTDLHSYYTKDFGQQGAREEMARVLNKGRMNQPTKSGWGDMEMFFNSFKSDPVGEGIGGGFGSFRTSLGLTKQTAGTQTIISDESIDKADRLKEAYIDLRREAQQSIAVLKLEGATLWMTSQQASRLAHEQEMINKATDAGIKLTPKQTAEIKGYASAMAAAEAETAKLKKSQDDMFELWQELGSIIADVFSGGIKSVDEFVEHVMSGFARIGQNNISKLFSEDNLKSLLSGEAFGSGDANNKSASWAAAQGKVFGKSAGEGIGDFLKNNGGTIGAGLGGLGMGYQSQNPIMGALGGALGGLSAGPIGAVVGGIAGLIGGLWGMRDALEKNKQVLKDNKDGIDDFINGSTGGQLSEYDRAMRQVNATAREYIKLAEAAGDSALVNRLKQSVNNYKELLKVEELRDQADEARKTLRESYEAEAEALEKTIARNNEFIDSITRYQQSLLLDKQFSPLSPEAMLQAAREQFEKIAAKAKMGDESAMGQLQGAASSYLSAARGYQGSSQGYQDTFANVNAILNEVTATTRTQTTTAQESLQLARDSIAVLTDIKDTMQTVAQATKVLADVTAAASAMATDNAKDLAKTLIAIQKALESTNLKKKVAA